MICLLSHLIQMESRRGTEHQSPACGKLLSTVRSTPSQRTVAPAEHNGLGLPPSHGLSTCPPWTWRQCFLLIFTGFLIAKEKYGPRRKFGKATESIKMQIWENSFSFFRSRGRPLLTSGCGSFRFSSSTVLAASRSPRMDNCGPLFLELKLVCWSLARHIKISSHTVG